MLTPAQLLLLTLSAQPRAAEAAYERARVHLETGDGRSAEESAREALELSLRFVPEEEIESRPDKGLLFEEMILEARQRYRDRRSRYFRVLGDALSAQEKWRAARKAYRRAPSEETLLLMADDPDLSVEERVELLLDAYLTSGAESAAVETALLDTGAFRSRNALDASVDRRRFVKLAPELGEVELLEGAFPEISAVTDGGTLVTGELARSGSLLVVYTPEESCGRCSEELDAITRPVALLSRQGIPIEVVAFVDEADLPVARRIVRLLGMPVAVGKRGSLPAALEFLDGGEIRIVARGGLSQIRLPMLPEGDLRPLVEKCLGLVAEPGLSREEREARGQPIVTLERQVNEYRTLFDWIERVDRLEAGPAPLDDLYAELGRLAQRVIRGASGGESRALGIELLQALSRLEGAHGAKNRALELLGERVADTLLERSKVLDPKVRRTASENVGVFYSAVKSPRVALQRSYYTDEGLRHFNFLLEDSGADLELVWVGAEEAPLGVDILDEGPVFHFAGEADCHGLKLVAGGEVRYESCEARIIDGVLVEGRNALVDDIEGAPQYYRRGVLSERDETKLERGLRLFQEKDFADAAEAFRRAVGEIDDQAPYDASDLVYDRARALEEGGQRLEALELYRSLGDVSYQSVVDERANAIETGHR
ncbi:MAG TPA: hypothetical protein VLK65_20785 [Vicinamibacteria bacterium]|nr:hypothetical protein [Vicinamibacteria bacterium]